MTATLTLALAITVPAGDSTWPAPPGLVLPPGYVEITLQVDTGQMATSASMEALLLVSYDDGATFTDLVGMGFSGGPHRAKGGGTTTLVWSHTRLPQSPYPSRILVSVKGCTAPSLVTISAVVA